MSDLPVTVRESRSFGFAVGLAITLVSGFQLFCVMDLPLAADDYYVLETVRGFGGLADCLDLSLHPLRPLLFGLFYMMRDLLLSDPALFRVITLALHLGALFFVNRVARQLGMGRVAAAVATCACAAFPHTTNLAWCSAVGWVGRQVFVLGSLSYFLSWRESRGFRDVVLCTLFFVLALGFHQGSFLIPGFFLIIEVFAFTRLPTPGWRRAFGNPLLLLVAGLSLLYLVYLGVFREQRYHGFQFLDVLVPNLAKGALSIFPGAFRSQVIDGLRGSGTDFGLAVALYCLAPLTYLALLSRRGVARALGICLLVELALPMVVSGFTQRYCYLASAFFCVALVQVVAEVQGLTRIVASVILLILMTFWVLDSGREIQEHIEAGAIVENLIADTSRFCAESGEGGIALVDVPDGWGSDLTIPVFRWAFPAALRLHRVQKEVLLFGRSRDHRPGEATLISDQGLRKLDARKGMQVFEFDTTTLRLRPYAGG